MSKEVSNNAASRPEWVSEQGKSEGEQSIWNSAYDQIHRQNHYMRGEGPAQALERLKEQGLLPDMAVDNIPALARQHVQAELGKHGSLHRDYYTTHDRVLSTAAEKQEIVKLVECEKKDWQAQRLAPTSAQLDTALRPEVVRALADAGLDADPQRLRDGIIERLKADKALSSADMEKMKSCPVGAPFVATGAVTGRQMDGIIAEQKQFRDAMRRDDSLNALKESDPEEFKRAWQDILLKSDVGNLLRKHASQDPRHYSLQKIEAADLLITTLQEQFKH